MTCVVIADAHLGMARPHRVRAVEAFVSRQRQHGRHVVWGGDTYDTFHHAWAEDEYAYLVQPGDTFMRGNHDYAATGLRQARIGRTLVVHGDLLDFGYAFARLAALRRAPLSRGYTLVERLLAALRPWSPFDVYALYRVQFDLSDDEARVFQHPSPVAEWQKIPTYLRVLRSLLHAPLRPYPDTFPTLPPLRGQGGYGGYFTTDPDVLMTRALAFYPTLRDCDTIIFGHLHRVIDAHVTCDDGRVRRLISLGAAMNDDATAAVLASDGTVISTERI